MLIADDDEAELEIGRYQKDGVRRQTRE